MKLERPTTSGNRRRLKVATQRSVHMSGGQDAVSLITRVNQQTLSDYSNTGNERHKDSFMPVDVLADLIVDSAQRDEVTPLLELLCELAGGRFEHVRGGRPHELIDTLQRDLSKLREQIEGQEVSAGFGGFNHSERVR
ncbi:hypothetical protein IWQ49_000052 [Labrenzia sp. EL_126]|nr:hypothetical protein [Labrenzia sp. EL_126]